MSSVLGYFKNSYSVVLLAILLSVILTWGSALINGRELEKNDFVEGIVSSTLISIGIVFINGLKTVNVEEVLTGVAPF
jgi:ABC-type Mn2+/Zn2+ transport system permease subunit